jgi:hypothetical protein
MPPVLFAAMSDRLVAVVRWAAMGTADGPQRSAWRALGLALLYVLRFAVAAPSTVKGARRALLNATPLPALTTGQPLPIGAAGGPSGGLCSRCGSWFTSSACPDCGSAAGESGERPGWEPPRAGTKTARFLALVAERYGPLAGLDLSKVSRVAGELAPEVGLHPGSARTALRAAVLAAQAGGAE